MSMPPPKSDDPLLTAYALGEADAAERQAVEKILSESAEARAEVEQIRALALALTAGYAREHESYLASRKAVDPPVNVVAFPATRHRRWQRPASLLLKVAAALVLATPVYVALRSTRRHEPVAVASAPTGPTAPVAAIPSDASDELRKESAREKRDEVDAVQMVGSTPSLAAAPPVPTADAPATSIDTLVASENRQQPETAVSQASRARMAVPSTAASLPASVSRRGIVSPPSGVVGLPGDPAGSATPDEQIAQSVVRVRSSADKFSVGVVVSADGLILSHLPPSEHAMQAHPTVRLADDRELPASAQGAKIGAGWYWLRVDAGALPAAALANSEPTRNAPLVMALIDPRSGALKLSHVQLADVTSVNAPFAFNSAGELLLGESTKAYTVALAKATRDRSILTGFIVRPFTPAERQLLRDAVERKAPN